MSVFQHSMKEAKSLQMRKYGDVQVSFQTDTPSFGLYDSTDEIILNLAKTSYIVTRAASLFTGSVFLVHMLTFLIFGFVFLRSNKYLEKYLKDKTFDNIYITSYFNRVDKRRQTELRSTLLPLRMSEKKRYINVSSLIFQAPESRSMVKVIAHILTVLLIASFIFSVDYVYSSMLEVLRISTIENVKADDFKIQSSINAEFKGEGASFMQSIFEKLSTGMKRLKTETASTNRTLQNCVPNVKQTDGMILVEFGVYIIGLLVLGFIGPLFARLNPIICAYFYPHIERLRICHLYNIMLQHRAKMDNFSRNTLAEKILNKMTRIDDNGDILLPLRQKYPRFAPILKLFAKHRCMLCNARETNTFVPCMKCKTQYCNDCFHEVNKTCPVCYIQGLRKYDTDCLLKAKEKYFETNK